MQQVNVALSDANTLDQMVKTNLFCHKVGRQKSMAINYIMDRWSKPELEIVKFEPNTQCYVYKITLSDDNIEKLDSFCEYYGVSRRLVIETMVKQFTDSEKGSRSHMEARIAELEAQYGKLILENLELKTKLRNIKEAIGEI